VSRRARIALGALVLVYLPVFAYVVIVTTPSYSLLPRVWVVVLPVVLASLGAGLMLSERAAQVAAWAAVALLAAALLDNVFSIVAYLADWEKRRGAGELEAWLAAVRQSRSHLWHWAAVLAPALAAAGVLFRARAARRPSPRR
jgi:hypothetical protein